MVTTVARIDSTTTGESNIFQRNIFQNANIFQHFSTPCHFRLCANIFQQIFQNADNKVKRGDFCRFLFESTTKKCQSCSFFLTRLQFCSNLRYSWQFFRRIVTHLLEIHKIFAKKMVEKFSTYNQKIFQQLISFKMLISFNTFSTN